MCCAPLDLSLRDELRLLRAWLRPGREAPVARDGHQSGAPEEPVLVEG